LKALDYNYEELQQNMKFVSRRLECLQTTKPKEKNLIFAPISEEFGLTIITSFV